MNPTISVPATSYVFQPGLGNDVFASKLSDKQGNIVALFPPFDYDDIPEEYRTYYVILDGEDNAKIHALDDEIDMEFVRHVQNEYGYKYVELMREEINFVTLPV